MFTHNVNRDTAQLGKYSAPILKPRFQNIEYSEQSYEISNLKKENGKVEIFDFSSLWSLFSSVRIPHDIFCIFCMLFDFYDPVVASLGPIRSDRIQSIQGSINRRSRGWRASIKVKLLKTVLQLQLSSFFFNICLL